MLLIAGSVSPHAYALKPSDARQLQAADLIIWVGEPLEVFLKKPLASLARDARVITLIEQEDIVSRVLGHVKSQLLVAAADASKNRQHDHGHAVHDLVDPHIWLDPYNAMEVVKLIAQVLSTLDPGNAETYKRNSQKLTHKLVDLHTTLQRQLRPIVDKPYIVFHDAYRLFEMRYGLNGIGAITLGPDRQPGARRLHRVRQLIISRGVSCIFNEPQFEPKWMNSVLQGTPAKAALLDPIGSGYKAGPQAYFALMLGLSRSLLGCLLDGPARGH